MADSRASRRRLRRASSRLVRSSSSTPARAASRCRASGKPTPSRSITKLKMSPPLPQPKHFHECRGGVTTNEGVFSEWNGQSPLYDWPAFLRGTCSPMNSMMSSFDLISAVTPTDKRLLLQPPDRGPRQDLRLTAAETPVAVSTLDTAFRLILTPSRAFVTYPRGVLTCQVPGDAGADSKMAERKWTISQAVVIAVARSGCAALVSTMSNPTMRPRRASASSNPPTL